MTGVLYGVGLGPGDPELITVKAKKLIQNSKIVLFRSTQHYHLTKASPEQIAYWEDWFWSNIEKNGVFDYLIRDINKLRDAITLMLVQNKKNGHNTFLTLESIS